MYMYTQGHSRLISTGAFIPESRVTTRELLEEINCETRFGIPATWLERVTGIKEKSASGPGVAPSDLATEAAKEALERAGVLPSEIDAIIYTGLTRDFHEPATAHILQAKLSAWNATVLDVSNACHGFMNGIHLMDALIATGQVRRGLVVTGEQGSLFAEKAITALKQTNDHQKLIELAASLTGGDAGAAIVMGPKLGPDSGFMGFMLRSQGQHAHLCVSGGPLEGGPAVTDMPGIIGESTKLVVSLFNEFLHQRLKWRVEDLSRYVIHQVGSGTFKLHQKTMGIPLEIMPKTVETLGNIITATIPVNLHILSKQSEIQEGQKVYLSGVGSGISLSQAGLIWDAA